MSAYQCVGQAAKKPAFVSNAVLRFGSDLEVAGIFDRFAEVLGQERSGFHDHVASRAMGAIDRAVRGAARARHPSEGGCRSREIPIGLDQEVAAIRGD